MLQKDLKSIENWRSQWKMVLNVSKCAILRVTNKPEVVSCAYTLNSQPLKSVDHYKYLGVVFDKNLLWNKHIEQKCATVNKTLR